MAAHDGSQSSPEQTGSPVERAVGTLEERLSALGFDRLEGASPEVLKGVLEEWKNEYLSIDDPTDRSLFYDLTRKALKGVHSSPKQLLDSLLPSEVEEATEGKKASVPNLQDFANPWEEEVSGAELLSEIADLIRRYTIPPKDAPEIVALYVMFTYVFQAFDCFPILHVMSAIPRSGKSRVAFLMACVANKAKPTSGISASVFFRLADKPKPCFLIDETDAFLKGNELFRGILNASHSRTFGVIDRCNPNTLEPESFECWGPKALFGINELANTIEDRSIQILWKRKKPTEKHGKYREHLLNKDLSPLRRKLTRWAQDHIEELEGYEPELPDLSNDRAEDNWFALVAVADLCGGEWPAIARRIMVEIDQQARAEDENSEVRLTALWDLASILEKDGKDGVLPSAEVVEAMVEMKDRPWGEWSKGRPITQRGLGRLFRLFGFKTKGARWTDSYGKTSFPKVYSLHDPGLKDELERHPRPEAPQAPQSSNDGDNPDNSKRHKGPSVADSKTPETPHKTTTVADVADRSNGLTQTTTSCGTADFFAEVLNPSPSEPTEYPPDPIADRDLEDDYEIN